MNHIAELVKRLQERKALLQGEILRLVREDASKYKFSVLAGRLKEIEEQESDIELVMKSKDS